MTKLITTVLLATAATAVIAAGPASARTRHQAQRVDVTQPYAGEGDLVRYSANDPYVVTDGARYIGRDPDIQIRSQILKDESSYNGNN